MLDMQWINSGAEAVFMAFLTAAGIYLALIACTRLVGLRSFSKLSSFDFAITVAIGSIIATVIVSKNPSLLLGAAALASIYLLQSALASFRARVSWVSDLVDNKPVLIMEGPRILEDNLKRVKMTREDLYAKLRESNVTDRSQVLAVVFESTGDISVLHSGSRSEELDPELLLGVREP
jgi:uncharacterized membrane protein YcaP (DUF421 family)